MSDSTWQKNNARRSQLEFLFLIGRGNTLLCSRLSKTADREGHLITGTVPVHVEQLAHRVPLGGGGGLVGKRTLTTKNR